MENSEIENVQNESLTLDGYPVTPELLQEKLRDKSIRVVEVSPGQYKTLQHFQG